jgi:hypothetical protein
LPIIVFLVSSWSLPSREANNGVIVNETKRLIRVENTTTRENSLSIPPIIPDTNARGRKTTTSTMVIATAVNPISDLPSMAALRRSLPISMWRLIFSSTTMESSTRIPIIKESAINVSILSEKLKIYIATKTEMMEAGIEINTIKEFRILCRKMNITKATNKMAYIKSFITAFAEAKVYVELSVPMLNLRL